MKKLFAFILVACMMFSMLAVIASANVDCEPVEFRDENGTPIAYQKYNPETNKVEEFPADKLQNGIVPKVSTPFTIDGVWEDNYYAGLRVNCTQTASSGDGDGEFAPKGEAWILYDDSYLYAFITVYDKTPWIIDNYITICPECGKQRGQWSNCEHMEDYDTYLGRAINMWDDDNLEFWVNWRNSDVFGDSWAYRISRGGKTSHDWDTWDVGFSGKGRDNGDMWYAELAVSLDTSKKGTELGLGIMLHDMTTFTEEKYRECYTFENSSNSPVMGGAGQNALFDYMVLGDEIEDVVLGEKPQPPVPVDPVTPVVPTENALTDDATGISVAYADGKAFADGVSLAVKPLSDADVDPDMVKALGDRQFKAYDITLEANGEAIQPDGSVYVTMPIPEGFASARCAAYHYGDSLENMNGSVDGNNIVFVANHFSTYLVVQENKDVNNPSTGDPIVLVVLAAVAALGAAVTVKKVCFSK